MKSGMVLIELLLFTVLITVDAQYISFDFSQPVTTTQLRAVAADGYPNVTMRGLAPTGTFDTNFCSNVMHSVLAQVGSQMYASPAPSKDAKAQVHALNDGLYKCNFFYRSFWLQVVNPSNWLDVNSNVQFIMDFVTEASKVYHQDVGIFTTAEEWNAITGGINITEVSGLYHPLWYRGTTQDMNFNDFRSFGGWVSPAMKQLKAIVVEQISGFSNLVVHNW